MHCGVTMAQTTHVLQLWDVYRNSLRSSYGRSVCMANVRRSVAVEYEVVLL